MSLRDQIKQYAEHAPEARAGGNFVQYGKLSCTLSVLTWQGKGTAPIKLPYKEGMEIEEGKQALEIRFDINVKEINPALEFDSWSRNVLVEASGPKIKTNWTEIVYPSLQATFGDEWADVVSGKKSYYVECEQADSANPPPAGKRDYGVPKFLRKFKNLAECKTARDERFGSADDEEATLGIPEPVIEQAKALLKSLKGNKDKLRDMLATKPFGEYDEDAILAELE